MSKIGAMLLGVLTALHVQAQQPQWWWEKNDTGTKYNTTKTVGSNARTLSSNPTGTNVAINKDSSSQPPIIIMTGTGGTIDPTKPEFAIAVEDGTTTTLDHTQVTTHQYVITVTNNGGAGGSAEVNWSYSDALITQISAACIFMQTGSSCGTTAANTAQIYLPPGSTVELTVRYKAGISGISNKFTANVLANQGSVDSNTSNNTASDVNYYANKSSDVSVTSTYVPPTIKASQNTSFIFIINNSGPDEAKGTATATANVSHNMWAIQGSSCACTAPGTCNLNFSDKFDLTIPSGGSCTLYPRFMSSLPSGTASLTMAYAPDPTYLDTNSANNQITTAPVGIISNDTTAAASVTVTPTATGVMTTNSTRIFNIQATLSALPGAYTPNYFSVFIPVSIRNMGTNAYIVSNSCGWITPVNATTFTAGCNVIVNSGTANFGSFEVIGGAPLIASSLFDQVTNSSSAPTGSAVTQVLTATPDVAVSWTTMPANQVAANQATYTNAVARVINSGSSPVIGKVTITSSSNITLNLAGATTATVTGTPTVAKQADNTINYTLPAGASFTITIPYKGGAAMGPGFMTVSAVNSSPALDANVADNTLTKTVAVGSTLLNTRAISITDNKTSSLENSTSTYTAQICTSPSTVANTVDVTTTATTTGGVTLVSVGTPSVTTISASSTCTPSAGGSLVCNFPASGLAACATYTVPVTLGANVGGVGGGVSVTVNAALRESASIADSFSTDNAMTDTNSVGTTAVDIKLTAPTAPTSMDGTQDYFADIQVSAEGNKSASGTFSFSNNAPTQQALSLYDCVAFPGATCDKNTGNFTLPANTNGFITFRVKFTKAIASQGTSVTTTFTATPTGAYPDTYMANNTATWTYTVADSCTLPWGGTIANAATTGNIFNLPANNCTSFNCNGEAYQTRTCSNGTLSGSYLCPTCKFPNLTGKFCSFTLGTNLATVNGTPYWQYSNPKIAITGRNYFIQAMMANPASVWEDYNPVIANTKTFNPYLKLMSRYNYPYGKMLGVLLTDTVGVFYLYKWNGTAWVVHSTNEALWSDGTIKSLDNNLTYTTGTTPGAPISIPLANGTDSNGIKYRVVWQELSPYSECSSSLAIQPNAFSSSN